MGSHRCRSWFASCSLIGMHTWRSAAVLAAAIAAIPASAAPQAQDVAVDGETPLRARDPAAGREVHVRPISPGLRLLIEESAERSPLFRSLVDQIERSNVIVYLDYHLVREGEADGRLLFLGAGGGRRYVLIQIACLRRRVEEFALVAHELRHATEVAAAPAIVDAPSMARHYKTIGTLVHESPGRQCYETRAAKEFGQRVQDQILASTRSETTAEERRLSRRDERAHMRARVRDRDLAPDPRSQLTGPVGTCRRFRR